jgi:hypothetical protein
MKRLFFWVTVSEVSVQGLDVGDTEHHGGVCVVRESPSPHSVWDAERRRRERERQRERERKRKEDKMQSPRTHHLHLLIFQPPPNGP